MATNTPLLSRIRVLASGIEATTGTAETLDASDAALNILNPELTRDDTNNDREIQASLGRLASTPGMDSGQLKCRTELTGNGASGLPLWATTFLPACDWEATGSTYAATRGATTLTHELYEDGNKRKLWGARGDFEITFEDGKPAYVDWTFRGKYSGLEAAAILAPTFPTVVAPVCKGMTLTLGGVSLRLSRFVLRAGNDVQIREDVTDATGVYAAAIVDRNPTGEADPEVVALATWNPETLRSASTEGALSIILGSASNNTITIAATKCQVRALPIGDRHGLLIYQLALQFNSSTPFSIAFS